jgi:hypothetical protein
MHLGGRNLKLTTWSHAPVRGRTRNPARPSGAACFLLVLASMGRPCAMAAEGRTFEGPGIGTVSVSEPFFNPTIGQREAIGITLSEGGMLSISILDRDGYVVRRLLSERTVDAGTLWYEWDGRDDQGQIVPDESYSLKVDLAGSEASYSYFPARVAPYAVKVRFKGYDHLTGVLSYRLDEPARVHAQAGVAPLDPDTRERDGPVLKTIANREPRPGGAVVENWDGYDETGSIYVPDLPGFVVSIAATSLPRNAIIASGNLSRTFVEGIRARRGEPLFRADPAADHSHHRGLSTLDDVAPSLHVELIGADFSEGENVWLLSGRLLSGRVSLSGPSAVPFGRQPAELLIFVDGRRVRTLPEPRDGGTFEIDLGTRPPGAHVVALNWVSGYGPAAATCVRVRLRAPVTRARPGAAAAAEGGR